jgi:cytidine deaminase
MEDDLQQIASAARLRAYAPYSNFMVGAALLTESGRIFPGCNVENISFGLTLCAERVCVGMALEQGERSFKAITLVAKSQVPIVPCGACRQVLAEFSPQMKIISWTLSGDRAEFTLRELLPLPRQGILD